MGMCDDALRSWSMVRVEMVVGQRIGGTVNVCFYSQESLIGEYILLYIDSVT